MISKERMFYNFVAAEMTKDNETPPTYEEHIKDVTNPESDGHSIHSAIVIMMDEYAKQMSIGFAEWIEEKLWWFDYWIMQDGSETKNKVWNNDSANPVNYSTEQLYTKYLETL